MGAYFIFREKLIKDLTLLPVRDILLVQKWRKAMSLWLITRNDEGKYDENFRLVVRAATAKEARQIAANAACDEVWLNSKLSKCRKLFYEGKKGIIIVDSRAG
jgi:hypothetical protein